MQHLLQSWEHISKRKINRAFIKLKSVGEENKVQLRNRSAFALLTVIVWWLLAYFNRENALNMRQTYLPATTI